VHAAGGVIAKRMLPSRPLDSPGTARHWLPLSGAQSILKSLKDCRSSFRAFSCTYPVMPESSSAGQSGLAMTSAAPAGPQGAAGESGQGSALPMGPFATMPVTLHVRIPLSSFRLHTLTSLEPGSIVSSTWQGADDLPVTAGGIRIAWAEFAITDHKRSVRVTRIS